MQLYSYPAAKWQAYLSLVKNDLAMLEYCQELDPVASSLRDILAQYMLNFQTLPTEPMRPAKRLKRSTSPIASLPNMSGPSSKPRDLLTLLLCIPARPRGMAQTSLDLLRLVCQPFNAPTPSSTPQTKAERRSPSMLGDFLAEERETLNGFAERMEHTLRMLDGKMPFGWQRYQTSALYTGQATNLALTVAQGQRAWLMGH